MCIDNMFEKGIGYSGLQPGKTHLGKTEKMDFLLNYELYIRLSTFLSIFMIIALWELLAPRKIRTATRFIRWPSNIGISLISGFLLRVALPIMAIGLAIYARKHSHGVLNIFEFPEWLIIILSLLCLDLVIYFQHIMFHMVPLLWRLHRMHHTDPDLDVTSGSRFHPIEIVLSMVIKMAAVLVLGPAPAAVLIFEVWLNATAMFNHGNVFIPLKLDKLIRWILVTPDMHRIHHSIHRWETDSNFGFSLSWWDRLFGTYRDYPQDGHENMTIGVGMFRNPKYLGLHWLLIQPFLKERE